MPGEHTIINQKAPQLGRVVDGIEFQQFADAGLLRDLGEISNSENDARYRLFLVRGHGIALGSLQTKKAWIIDIAALLMAATTEGLDRPTALIEIPGEVHRG